MNKRSVAVVIDDNLSDKNPTPESLEAVAAIVSEHYGAIDFSSETLTGHRATFDTICPGNTFESHWRQEILKRVR